MFEPYVPDGEWLTRQVASISWNMKEPSYSAQLQTKTSRKHFSPTLEQRSCHVNQLPAELLMKVFCYLPWDRKCLSDNKPWNWLDIGRVCKLWREVVNLSAEFWSRVPLQNVHIAARSLQLSGDMPLCVFADFKEPWRPRNALALALANLPRITELSITGTIVLSCDWWYVAKCLCARRATNLRHLTMHFADEDGYGDFPGYHVFSGTPAPVLETLELRGFALPTADECSMFFVPSLISLVLSNCDLEYHWSTIEDTDNPDGPTVEAAEESIFDALRNLPLLQTLTIRDCKMPLDLDADEFAPPKQPLTFLHLRDLALEGNVRMVTRLLNNMVVPPTTSLNLWYHHVRPVARNDPAIDHTKAVSFFSNHFSAASSSGAFYSQTRISYDTGDESPIANTPLRHIVFEYHDPCTPDASHSLPVRTTLQHSWINDLDLKVYEYASFADSLSANIPCRTEHATLHISQFGKFNFQEMYLCDAWWYNLLVVRKNEAHSLILANDAVDVCSRLSYWQRGALLSLKSLELRGCRQRALRAFC